MERSHLSTEKVGKLNLTKESYPWWIKISINKTEWALNSLAKNPFPSSVLSFHSDAVITVLASHQPFSQQRILQEGQHLELFFFFGQMSSLLQGKRTQTCIFCLSRSAIGLPVQIPSMPHLGCRQRDWGNPMSQTPNKWSNRLGCMRGDDGG